MNSSLPRKDQGDKFDIEEKDLSLMSEIEEELAIMAALSDYSDEDDLADKRRLLNLMEETSAKLRLEAKERAKVRRNSPEALAEKANKRADYAEMIWRTEGRLVRDTQKATPERRKEQKKKSKANRSPEQVAKEREADKLAKREKRKREREEAAAKKIANPAFGIL